MKVIIGFYSYYRFLLYKKKLTLNYIILGAPVSYFVLQMVHLDIKYICIYFIRSLKYLNLIFIQYI